MGGCLKLNPPTPVGVGQVLWVPPLLILPPPPLPWLLKHFVECTAGSMLSVTQGLVAGHSYSILRLEFFNIRGTIFRLLQLRNPWGKTQVCVGVGCNRPGTEIGLCRPRDIWRPKLHMAGQRR